MCVYTKKGMDTVVPATATADLSEVFFDGGAYETMANHSQYHGTAGECGCSWLIKQSLTGLHKEVLTEM